MSSWLIVLLAYLACCAIATLWFMCASRRSMSGKAPSRLDHRRRAA